MRPPSAFRRECIGFNSIAEMARDAEADVRRKIEEEDARKRIEAARAERAKAEEEARIAREASAKALEERRAAEEAARLAKRDERTAEKAANTQLEDAVRLERRADKLDGAAQQSEADLSRGRGEYGSVGSRATRWTWRARTIRVSINR